MRKISMLRAVFAASLALAACGDSTSDGDAGDSTGGNATGGNGNGGTGGTGGTGANGGNTNGGPGGTNTGGGGCGENSGGMSSCTPQEEADYNNCLQGACVAERKKCWGDNWESGTYAGLCGASQKCVIDCDCDINCITKCPLPTMECTNCYMELSTCSTKACPTPACFTAGATGGDGTGGTGATGGKTCADLKACCDALAAGMEKDTCNQYLSAAMPNGDVACSGAYLAAMCK